MPNYTKSYLETEESLSENSLHASNGELKNNDAKSNSSQLPESWKSVIEGQFSLKYMKDLKSFLVSEYQAQKTIFPSKKDYFRALHLAPFDKIKVVIIGQDPYHGPGQAHGLSFSVPAGIPFPPSLQNIFKELRNDLNIPISTCGDLSQWASQGVLLLNSVLTVEQGRPASHQGRGWEIFTDAMIKAVNLHRPHVAFVLWGAYAQKKAGFVNRNKHFVLESPHPSPLSSHRGFFGSKPFSKVNQFLESRQIQQIDWTLQAKG